MTVDPATPVPAVHRLSFPATEGNGSDGAMAVFLAQLQSSSINVPFRITPVTSPPRTHREHDSVFIVASFADFTAWASSCPSSSSSSSSPSSSPFAVLPPFSAMEVAAYADYLYFKDVFAASDAVWLQPALVPVPSPGYDPMHFSADKHTLWLSSRGAHTPLHYDTYGVNVVRQLTGRKRWRLYGPQTAAAAGFPALRVPFEESTVYSSVDPLAPGGGALPLPDLDVVLDAGDVLVVPKHYWHVVETVSDVSLSVNLWLPVPLPVAPAPASHQASALPPPPPIRSDDRDRAVEAATKFILGAVIAAVGDASGSRLDDLRSGWLSPSEIHSGKEDGSEEESETTLSPWPDHARHLRDLLTCLRAERDAEATLKRFVNALLRPDRLDACVNEALMPM